MCLSGLWLFSVCAVLGRYAAAADIERQSFPMLGQLPSLGRDWSLREKGATKERGYENSWVAYTNSKTGDLMSFAAVKYSNKEHPDGIPTAVTRDPVREAAISMFPGGLPRFMLTKLDEWCVVDTIRFNTVTLETGTQGEVKQNRKAEALEYTYVYEHQNQQKHPNRLAHGYGMVFGATAIFVQHTSSHIIESHDVNSIALYLVENHR